MGCEASGGSWGRKLGMLALGCLSPSTGCFLPAFTAGLTSSPLKHIKGFPVSRTCSSLHPISPSPEVAFPAGPQHRHLTTKGCRCPGVRLRDVQGIASRGIACPAPLPRVTSQMPQFLPLLHAVFYPRPAHGFLPQIWPPEPSWSRKRPRGALPRPFRGLSRPKHPISVAERGRERLPGAAAPSGGPGEQHQRGVRPPLQSLSSALWTANPGLGCPVELIPDVGRIKKQAV